MNKTNKSTTNVHKPGRAPKPTGTDFILQNSQETTMKNFSDKQKQLRAQSSNAQKRLLSLRKFDTPKDCQIWRKMLTKEVKPRQKVTDNTNVEQINQVISQLKNEDKFMHHFDENNGRPNTVQQTLAKRTVYITNDALEKEDSEFGYCQKCKKDTFTCWQRKCMTEQIEGKGWYGKNKIGTRPVVPIDDFNSVIPNYKKSSRVEQSKQDSNPLRLELNNYKIGDPKYSFKVKDYNPDKKVMIRADNYFRDIYNDQTKVAPKSKSIYGQFSNPPYMIRK